MKQEKIGKFISRLRRQKDITQAQLADTLNTSVKTVSRWETGKTAIDLNYIEDLSRILEVSKEELLNGERKVELVDKIENDDRKTKRYFKRTMFMICSILLILLVVVTTLLLLNNHDDVHICSLKSNDHNFNVNGLLVETLQSDYLIINNVENISNFDLDSVELYSYEYTLYLDDKLEKQQLIIPLKISHT